MENWIFWGNEYMWVLALVIGVLLLIGISYCLAWLKEKISGGKRTIYP